MPLANIDYTVLISGLNHPWLSSVPTAPLLPPAATQFLFFYSYIVQLFFMWMHRLHRAPVVVVVLGQQNILE